MPLTTILFTFGSYYHFNHKQIERLQLCWKSNIIPKGIPSGNIIDKQHLNTVLMKNTLFAVNIVFS